MSSFSIVPGIPEGQIDEAASLYWDAFRGKLGLLMRPEDRALRFLTGIMDPGHAISALDDTEKLIGFAGYKTAQGSMVGGDFADLARVYGWFGALWRGSALSALEREIKQGVLLMDGICVATEGRGRGVGTALLNAIKTEAARRGLTAVRLDVIDTNPRARALYEREGFVAIATNRTGPLRLLFGFRSATTLECQIARAGP